MIARLLLALGDAVECGVPNAWPVNRWQWLCFDVSQWFYAQAWKLIDGRD